jgi:ABC-type transport system involved in cytochrome c biogenesis permease component
VGTLFAAMLVRARMKEVLLPLVVYPVVVPIIIGGVKATAGILNGYPSDEVVSWLRLMVAFDLVFVVLSVWLFERMWVE